RWEELRADDRGKKAEEAEIIPLQRIADSPRHQRSAQARSAPFRPHRRPPLLLDDLSQLNAFSGVHSDSTEYTLPVLRHLRRPRTPELSADAARRRLLGPGEGTVAHVRHAEGNSPPGVECSGVIELRAQAQVTSALSRRGI